MTRTTEEFIALGKKRYGDKFSYELTEYKSAKDKIRITCRLHGPFTTSVQAHLYGKGGCPKCAVETVANSKMYSGKSLRQKALPIHGDKYQYTDERHPDDKGKIKIICLKHGPFFMRPSVHVVQKQGCPKCGVERRSKFRTKSQEYFVNRVRGVHGNRFDLTFVTYNGIQEKVAIPCATHGKFLITPNDLYSGKGCPKCAHENIRTSLAEAEQLVRASYSNMGISYTLDPESYTGLRYSATLICEDHGPFQVNHLRRSLGRVSCPKCSTTKGQELLCSWLDSHSIPYEINNRSILAPQEIDIFLPEHNIGIELNGLYWHSAKVRPNPSYHLNKTQQAAEKGVRLIHIWEDQWEQPEQWRKVLNFFSHLLLLRKVVGARTCQILGVSQQEYEDFNNRYHLLGSANASIRRGLYLEGDLIAVIGCIKYKSHTLLTRYTVKPGITVPGGLARLLKNVPRPVITYCERAYFTGEVYAKAGFVKEQIRERPDLWYVSTKTNNARREFRRKFQKHKLPQLFGPENVDLSKTEKEICEENGWLQLWSCGHDKFVLDK